MKRQSVALLYGVVCHTSFAIGVSMMMYSIYYGLSEPIIPVTRFPRALWNGFLILQFPILHSFFLSNKGRKILGHLAPKDIRRDLGTTLFAITASFQLILVFGTWNGSDIAIWSPKSETILYVLSILYALSWLLLLRAMADSSLSIQTGLLGWWAVFRGKKPVYKSFARDGLNKYSRNPIYVSFALILWTAPHWTLDRLLLTGLWTAYCLIGPYFKEVRYQRFYGEDYKRYMQTVPYWFPFRLSVSGASRDEDHPLAVPKQQKENTSV